MNAVILVGGEGTRLRPLTCNTPKAMVPVLNRPFLEHVLQQLKSHGVETVILALGHLSKSVVDYFGDGARAGVKLIYSVEKQPLGTAGPIKLAEPYLHDRFIVLNGDVYADFNISLIVASHVRSGATATLTLVPVEDPSAFGVVETTPQGYVTRFVEKPKKEDARSNLINAGLYVLEPEVLQYIAPDARVMFEHNVFPALLAKRRPMHTFNHDGYWIDIGTPQKYLQLNLDLMRKSGSAGTNTPESMVNVLIADGCHIDKKAKIVGPAVVGAACDIGKGAIVSGSVIWECSTLGPGCRVDNSVIGNQSSIGSGATIRDSIVSDHVSLAPGTNLAPGSKLWPPDCQP